MVLWEGDGSFVIKQIIDDKGPFHKVRGAGDASSVSKLIVG